MERNYNDLEEFEFVDSKDQNDEIVIYRDVDDIGRVFVTSTTLQRFRMIEPVYKLLSDQGEDLFEISPRDVIYIVEHASNEYAPYTIRYQNFDFKNEIVDQAQKDKSVPATDNFDIVNIFRDIEDPDRAFVTLDVLERFQLAVPQHRVQIGDSMVYEIDSVDAINIINNRNNRFAPYQVHYVNLQFEQQPHLDKVEALEHLVEEGISPDINLRERTTKNIVPRSKRPDETDEDYVVFLEGFYDALYGRGELSEKEYRIKPHTQEPDATTKSNTNTTDQTDEEYVDYLRDYYNNLFNPELTESIKLKNVFQPSTHQFEEPQSDSQQVFSMLIPPAVREETGRIIK